MTARILPVPPVVSSPPTKEQVSAYLEWLESIVPKINAIEIGLPRAGISFTPISDLTDMQEYVNVRIEYNSGSVAYEKIPIKHGQTKGDALREVFGPVVTDDELRKAGIIK